MNKIYEESLLFDFYGELLTDKQKEYFDLHYNEDLSLAEIAQSEGISRQGVWDIIRRAEESLRRFEEKTGLVARFASQRELLSRADERISLLLPLTEGRAHDLAAETGEIIKELNNGI